jgi:hypothetical protein
MLTPDGEYLVDVLLFFQYVLSTKTAKEGCKWL